MPQSSKFQKPPKPQQQIKVGDFAERSNSYLIALSITLTISLLIVSAIIAIKLWEKNGGEIVTILIMFSVFNVLETFTSIFLILDNLKKEYNNQVRLRLLTYYLKKKGMISEDWVKETTVIVDESVTGGF